MKSFQYIISSQADEETIWVCAACKKARMEEILLGKWKLIDMTDNAHPCGACEDDKKVVNE